MTKGEFVKIADAIKTFYPTDKLLPNKEAMQLWYQELQDLPYEIAMVAVRKHVNTSRFPPTVADLREAAVSTTHKPQNWADGWENLRRAIRHFGYYQQEEALSSMDEMTRTVVIRLGWKELCMSENVMQDRANFRMVYEQEQRHVSEQAALPEGLKVQIGRLQNGGGVADERVYELPKQKTCMPR